MKDNSAAVKAYMKQSSAPKQNIMSFSKNQESPIDEAEKTGSSRDTSCLDPGVEIVDDSIWSPKSIPHLNFPNCAMTDQSREEYLSEKELVMVQKLFYSFEINSIDDFFTEEIKSDSSIVNLVKSLAYDLDSFASLTEAYRAGQLKEKKETLVSHHMNLIENAKNDVASNLLSIMSYKIKNTMPTLLLSCTAMKQKRGSQKIIDDYSTVAKSIV